MLAVVDYEAGNLHSVGRALKFLGSDFQVTADPQLLKNASRVILPGVGSARAAMASLEERRLIGTLRSLSVPLLGICLGMQLLFEFSEEEDTPCLGVIPGRVRRFDSTKGKVPHMGWNQVENAVSASDNRGELMCGIPPTSHFFFVHSYYAPVDSATTTAVCEYFHPFAAVVASANWQGAQFHPELSGPPGLRLLENFLDGDLQMDPAVETEQGSTCG